MIKLMRMRWARHVARMGQDKNVYRLVVRKAEGKMPLGRPRQMWVDIIRMDLGEMVWDDVDWISLAQDKDRWRALVNAVIKLWVS
jgi:hypothetical protein